MYDVSITAILIVDVKPPRSGADMSEQHESLNATEAGPCACLWVRALSQVHIANNPFGIREKDWGGPTKDSAHARLMVWYQSTDSDFEVIYSMDY